MKNNVRLVHLYEAVNIDENCNIQLLQLLLECAAIQVSGHKILCVIIFYLLSSLDKSISLICQVM